MLVLVSSRVVATPNILVFGDSISAEFGLQKNQGWVSLLKTRLSKKGYQYAVINASISGETSGGGLRRINQVLNKYQPEIIIIELGANDGLRGLKLSQLKNNLSNMIDQAHKHRAEVLLIGMRLPPNYGPGYTHAFSRVFATLSEEKKVSLLPFLFAGFETDLSYFQADQIHPNHKAQVRILDNVWQALSLSFFPTTPTK